jgi:hypothetical protein
MVAAAEQASTMLSRSSVAGDSSYLPRNGAFTLKKSGEEEEEEEEEFIRQLLAGCAYTAAALRC